MPFVCGKRGILIFRDTSENQSFIRALALLKKGRDSYWSATFARPAAFACTSFDARSNRKVAVVELEMDRGL